MKIFLYVFLMTTFLVHSLSCRADMIMEGETDIHFEIVNAEKFKDYDLYFMYQPYKYDKGYKKTDLVKKQVKQGELFKGGDRGDKTILMAQKGDLTFKGSQELGGKETVKNKSIKKIVQKVKIKKLKNGEINFQIKETLYLDAQGNEVKNETGFSFIDINNFSKGLMAYYILIPMLAMILLLWVGSLSKFRIQISR